MDWSDRIDSVGNVFEWEGIQTHFALLRMLLKHESLMGQIYFHEEKLANNLFKEWKKAIVQLSFLCIVYNIHQKGVKLHLSWRDRISQR